MIHGKQKVLVFDISGKIKRIDKALKVGGIKLVSEHGNRDPSTHQEQRTYYGMLKDVSIMIFIQMGPLAKNRWWIKGKAACRALAWCLGHHNISKSELVRWPWFSPKIVPQVVVVVVEMVVLESADTF